MMLVMMAFRPMGEIDRGYQRASYGSSGDLALITKKNHRKLHSVLYTIEPVHSLRKLFTVGTV